MPNRIAILNAVCAALAIVTGALVTDKVAGVTSIHIGLGVGITVVGALYTLAKPTRWSGAAVLVAGAVECIFRGGVTHALAAPVVFAACTAIALLTSSSPKPGGIENTSGLHALVLASPALVVLQIALGAAYRHKLTGVMPHLSGAMLVAGLLLIVCVLLLQRPAESGAVRRAAVLLLSMLLLQVSLGIAAFVMRLLDADNTRAFLVASVAHVTVGSFTLAASVVLVLQYAGRHSART